MLVHSIHVLQGSVATHFGSGWVLNDSFVANFRENLPVKKNVKMRRELEELKSYHSSWVYYFLGHSTVLYSVTEHSFLVCFDRSS